MIVCGMRCSRITNARNLVSSSSNAVLDKRRLDSYNALFVANFVRYYYYFFLLLSHGLDNYTMPMFPVQ